MIITNGFGYGAFFIPLIFGTIGLYLLKFPNIKPFKLSVKFAFAAIILSLILGFIFVKSTSYLGSGPGGAQGYLVIRWSNAFIGMIGTAVILIFLTVSYLIFALKVKPESFGMKLPSFMKFRKKTGNPLLVPETDNIENSEGDENEETGASIPEIKTVNEKYRDKEEVEFVVTTSTLIYNSQRAS